MGESQPPELAADGRGSLDSEHLAAIVRSSDDAILSQDMDGLITSWNRAAERLFGYTADELIGKPVTILAPPHHDGRYSEVLESVLAGDFVEHFETERLRKDGRVLAVSLTVSPIHDDSGRTVGASAQARDITGRAGSAEEVEKARQALQEAEQRFRSAFDDAPIGMAVVSVDDADFGLLSQSNTAFCELVGYSCDELAGMRVAGVTYGPDLERELGMLDGLLAGQRDSYEIEKRLIHKDGSLVWAGVNVSLLRGVDGPRQVVAHVMDISERKSAEDELAVTRANLERSNAELDQFAYVASHDLKEPLILLSAYARMLRERYGDALDDEGRTFLGHVLDEAARMKTMIDDLLDYARLETDGTERERVDLADAVETALRTLKPNLEASDGGVEVKGPLPVVEGSPTQFERLFRNLISNGLKFRGDEPPAVVVTAGREGDEVLIEVRDNGIGMDPAKADKAFDVFQRLHGQERYPGTGMGLAICKRIVERHGGRIWVESAKGAGSAFKLTLPG